MKVFRSYLRGIQEATLQPKMIFILWLINFIFGLAIFYVSYGIFCGAIGESLASETLLKEFDYNVFFEFLDNHGGAVKTILSIIFALILIYFLVSIFLIGGILFSLIHSTYSNDAAKRRFSQTFFQGAGKFFGRFFRVSIYSLILWLVFIIVNVLLTQLGRVLTGHGSNEPAIFYYFWIRVGIGLFLLYLIKMILDYTRIKIVTEDSRRVFLSLFQTIKFVFKNLGKTLALYYLFLLTGIIVFIVCWILKSIVTANSLATIVIALVVGQIFIAARCWMKIAFQSGQLAFFSSPHSESRE